ncbi:hypothetical protein LOTGIDRAFT_235256 [Lottia gigantea]|uniref:Nucleoporin NDC1 n=1 Tax=Lottia gigantea TaxID=225164 RepID=V4A053_LOTGI|nr:hypothetical protein LOTGIDRAFT_235256 [Lottia gigantea]ESO86631.1 hypothetical protein LOTGIDRAFT_235256 [Lottia gigantea]
MEFQKLQPTVETINAWFMQEVYLWRTVGSVFWFLACVPVITSIYILLCNISVFHPVTTIVDMLSTLFSASFLLCVIPILTINGILITYSSRLFTVIPDIGSTRFANLLRLVGVKRLPHVGLFSLCGMITVWCSTTFIGSKYSSLTQSPDGHIVQLNEHHIFLVVFGLFEGISYYVKFDLNHFNCLQFPLIQREKFFVFRSSVCGVFLRMLKETIREIKYYYLLYYFFGGAITSWIAFNLNLQYCKDDVPLDTIFGLLNFSLLWQVVVLGIYLNFSWSIGHLIFKIYQTEKYEFHIDAVFEKKKSLHDALNCNKQPLVKYLGYLDLSYLSKCSYERRQQVFCLSQPGGHPHTWNKISAACLAELNTLNQQIEAANWQAYSNVPVKKTSNIFDKNYTLGETSEDSMFHRTTNDNISVNKHNGSTFSIDTSTETKPKSIPWKDKLCGVMSKKPILGYFMGELPDSKTSQLFCSSQVQIWAVEALSYLISASYHEDKFGIVQRSLPVIISSLVNLQENVDKHFKLIAPAQKRHQKQCSVNYSLLRQELQAVLKSSIHRIIERFGKHLCDLPLKSESIKKLKPFVEFKE